MLMTLSCVVQGKMTLLLGPPGAGKTTLLKALAGKLQRSPDLKVPCLLRRPFTSAQGSNMTSLSADGLVRRCGT